VKRIAALALASGLVWLGCGAESEAPAAKPEAAPPPPSAAAPEPQGPDPEALRQRAAGFFGTLPAEVPNPENPITEAKVALGRLLYHDPRLSKAQEISCNTCHQLDRFGVDGEATSPGHRGQRGDRNSPTVYNAALHLAQFWDGRAADVEEQALGPMLNPIEMAMADEIAVLAVIASIPAYPPMFEEAFPEEDPALRFHNVGKAIGAFERRLLTPTPFDAFLAGDDNALTAAQLDGLETFLNAGCTTCHQGVGLGGGMYQKLGLVRDYPTEDPGRAAVTGNDADQHVFKVPSLRNVAETGPWFHDGSIDSLEEAIRVMGAVQLDRDLNHGEVVSIRAFFEALTGTPPAVAAAPELPENGPDTPAPDPS